MGTKVFCNICNAFYGQYDRIVLNGQLMSVDGFTLADGSKPVFGTKATPCRQCGQSLLRLDNTTLPENIPKVPEIAGAYRLSA